MEKTLDILAFLVETTFSKGSMVMDVKTYLEEKNMKQSELAKASGLNPCILTHHLRSGRKLTPYIAKRLEAGTNGELNAVELVFNEPSSQSSVSPSPAGDLEHAEVGRA